VSYEAGSSYLRLLKERGATTDEEPTAKVIQTNLTRFEKLPLAMTPLVLSLHPTGNLADLLTPDAHVRFDLDGTGQPRFYQWLKPDTAMLVWDPSHAGRIESGRQLFGSVTWWIFWKDGYQALSALDDDHDGWIRGAELTGLALWFDRNQNGVSDPGEVVPIERTGIEALAANSNGWDGASPMNSGGVLMKDGRVLPSWDWVVTSEPMRLTQTR
jgi:hypothetical protein